VTKAEHDRLKPLDRTYEGWAIYIAAGIEGLAMKDGQPVGLLTLKEGRRG